MRKWLARFQAAGTAELANRLVLGELGGPTPMGVRDGIVALRRYKMPGRQNAMMIGVWLAHVGCILAGAGLSRVKISI